jgi:cytidylate kinase
MATFTRALLEAGDDTCSNAIIRAFEEDSTFQQFATNETNGIVQRDAEDGEKLAVGIRKAVAKGVIPADPPVEPVCRVDVKGKSADAVADEIIEKLGDAPQTGCVLVLQGLSGTGKGTTVAKLQAKLPRAVCWSNGNVFRSLTLLAVSHCERQGVPFSPDVLTPDLLQELMAQLQFGKFDGKFDTHIAGAHDVYVSAVANTVLKEPRVGKNIPTVAEVSQGEIIKFAGDAADQMSADGMNVLMEGRAQTLDYVRTPHRFELVLSEPGIIGMRRAAQRMSASALKGLSQDASHDEVQDALAKALAEMAGAS